MFENTGVKLKGLAFSTFMLHIFVSFFGGVWMIVEDDDLIVAGICVMAGGSIIGFIISLLISAFGELVCAATASEGYLKELSDRAKKNNVPNTNIKASVTNKTTVPADAYSSKFNQEKIPAWKRVQMEGEQ